jgi:signal transduction histidine kinase/DNA-binding response OmpR family regulator
MRKVLPILLLLLSCVIHAQQPVIYKLDPQRQLHDLKAYTSVLVDPLQKFTAAQVISGSLDKDFKPWQQTTPVKGITYWLQIHIQADSAVSNYRMLLRDNLEESGYTSQNDSVDVFYTDGAGRLLLQQHTGVLIARSEKQLRAPAGVNAVPFSASAGNFYKIYIRVRKVFSDKPFLSYPVLQDDAIPLPLVGHGSMLSTLNIVSLLFCILSFFFFVFIRDKAYLLFTIYTFILSQHYLILHPDLPFIDLYIAEQPQLVDGFWVLLTNGSFISFGLFGRWFIHLKKLSPKTDQWYLRFLVFYGACTLANAISLMVYRNGFLPPQLFYLIFVGQLAFFVRFAFFKSVLARLYIGGALWLLCFTTLGILWGNGIIHLPFNPWPVGQVGQLLIYAVALAYKFRLNEAARAEAAIIKDMDAIKSRFFANISHEFRTPLTLIQGPLKQIEDMSPRKEGDVTIPVRYVKTMRRNTDRLLELVNQLLDLSRIDSGKMKLQVIKGDLLQLLKVSTASFESLAERKAIHYRVHFPQETLIAFFDKDKLEKIVSNLLTNAFKYTPEQGTVSVSITIEEGRLRLSVDDSGPGIRKNELDKIFERFYQVEGTHDKGSGIGLALVKELIEVYRGQISVSSEPGKGSRFKISLPVAKEAFKEDEFVYGEWKQEETFILSHVHNETETSIGKTAAESQLPLLLVIEDNSDLRHFIKETVQPQYNVVEAINGEEGWQKAAAEIPDIIISDVMMPVMDGFAMTEKLKKDERTSHIPVILLTAKAGQQHKIEGLQTGADDYLTKPFDAAELLTRIHNLVHQRKLLRKKFAGEIILKPSEIAVTNMDETFLNKVMQAIEINMGEEEFGVEELAKEVAMSRSQLHRKMMALTGQSPSEVLRNTRLLRAKELLQKKAVTPSEAAFRVGFSSHTYFSKCFKEEFGVSPSEI